MTPELQRLADDAQRRKNWKRWGPYLAERQWGTVREDYSESGDCWAFFPHEHARSRVYRWGEDGLLGICDRECRLAFALALWNGNDPILKERLFGLTNPEGNHGEDVKECYYYLDSTPTHSYMKALYKYPQRAYPYADLIDTNGQRGYGDREYELADTGVFDDNRYFDVIAEYAKADQDDICIRITVANRGPDTATLHLLPTLWYRNSWSWGRTGERFHAKPSLRADGAHRIVGAHATLGTSVLELSPASGGEEPQLLFTENESNTQRLFGVPNASTYVKDAFHDYVVSGKSEAVNPQRTGTKAAACYRLDIPAGEERVVELRLSSRAPASTENGAQHGQSFSDVFAARIREADEFYAALIVEPVSVEERRVARQAYAGLLWTKQFYHYSVIEWLEGDPAFPPPPTARRRGRNAQWSHVYHADVLSMPDKWEYPWFAAWDLAFHMLPMAMVDPQFAKDQLVLMLREWYMHPNGQLAAYEFAFDDVNPPVHAWAAWRVYKMTAPRGQRDRIFLERVFQKLMINFTWWVNRKDPDGHNLFSGGFLGLDNIGVFDRSKPLPTGGHLAQADGTAWMAFYCNTMLSMALELASEDAAYEDVASKFFEHLVAITDAMNSLGGTGLWHEEDGFYYDQLFSGDVHTPLCVRSLVGLVPLFACEVIEDNVIAKLPGFRKRMEWFLRNRPDLGRHITYMEEGKTGYGHRLLAIPSRERLVRVLRYALDESEFLSSYGIRSVSRVHKDHPFVFRHGDEESRVDYDPAEGTTGMFGGNSNWRGPIWFPMNYLFIEALERYGHFYGEEFTVECPVGSGKMLTLPQVSQELSARLARIFLPDAEGNRPCHDGDLRYAKDPHWRDLVLFHEYFHGDTGRGIGASHQTGWTSLVVRCLDSLASSRRPNARYRASGRHSVVMESIP
ncbi:MAG: hypothetical protein JWL61_4230 [Gemmatimonadetes bacterium]|nr:hypothetical protein [Gemmatimonadota bacterium]